MVCLRPLSSTAVNRFSLYRAYRPICVTHSANFRSRSSPLTGELKIRHAWPASPSMACTVTQTLTHATPENSVSTPQNLCQARSFMPGGHNMTQTRLVTFEKIITLFASICESRLSGIMKRSNHDIKLSQWDSLAYCVQARNINSPWCRSVITFSTVYHT